LSKARYLLDVNVLVALTDEDHVHHKLAAKWLDGARDSEWGVCAFTEAGFLRVATNPKAGAHTVEEATAVLASLAGQPSYKFWPISDGWVDLVAPFHDRVFGHQQITDAYLLGLAVKENGVLVTMDKAIKVLAGKYGRHVLVLA
jgi:hypothetical protein